MKKIILFMLLALVSVNISAKKQKKIKIKFFTAYVYGMAVDFSDSTAYFTNIQKMDSIYFIPKTKLYGSRNEYEQQLQEYFREQGMAHRIITVFFSKNLKKAEKQNLRVRQRMLKRDNLTAKTIAASEFVFRNEIPSSDDYQLPDKPKKSKKGKKGRMGPRPDGKGPHGGPGGMPPGGGMGGPGGGF